MIIFEGYVAISGDFVFIGAFGDDIDKIANQGSASIFYNNSGS